MIEATWGLVGYGTIGQEVSRQLAQPEVAHRMRFRTAPEFIIRSNGVMAPDGVTPTGQKSLEDVDYMPDIVFVATPPTDDGHEGYNTIMTVLEAGRMAVTAEKGAVANYFSELRRRSYNFTRLGINATVGGGTRMLSIANEYCQDLGNVTQLHLVLNGTLTAIMSSIAPRQGTGMSLGQAVHQAVSLGYAEPGAEKPADVIRNEAIGDIPRKTSIFMNSLGITNRQIDWRDLQFPLSDEEIARVVEEARVRRFIVSLYSERYVNQHTTCPEQDIISGFVRDYGGWRVAGGFRNIERNPLFAPLGNLTGPGNGMVVGLGPDETDGVNVVIGPGAGARPTANTMIDNAFSMRNQR